MFSLLYGKKGFGFFLSFLAISLLVVIALIVSTILNTEETGTSQKQVGEKAQTINAFTLESAFFSFDHDNFAAYAFDKALIALADGGGFYESCTPQYDTHLITATCVIEEKTLLANFTTFYKEAFAFYLEQKQDETLSENYTYSFVKIENTTQASLDAKFTIKRNGNGVDYTFTPDITFTIPYDFSDFLNMQEKVTEALSCLKRKELGCLRESEGFHGVEHHDTFVIFFYGPIHYKLHDQEPLYIRSGVQLKKTTQLQNIAAAP